MTATAAMARPKAPFYRSRTSRNYRRTAENALFAVFFRPFYYRNPCIKNVVLIELKTSPVDDFYYGLTFLFIIYIICFVNIFIQKEIIIVIFLNALFSASISILKEYNRLESDYQSNLEKAKIIFMKYHGDNQLLKENEEYYTYQVDSNSEACWYKELVDKMK